MTRSERQIKCIKSWIAAKGKGSIEAATGFGCLLNETRL